MLSEEDKSDRCIWVNGTTRQGSLVVSGAEIFLKKAMLEGV
jgi:hypothetical protein